MIMSSRMNATNHTSQIWYEYSTGFHLFSAISLAIIIMASIVGNVLVFAAFYVNPSLRKPANYLIISLAFSDLVTATFVMTFELDCLIKQYKWDYGETMCDVWATLFLISTPASVINLCAIAVTRYICISKPMKYQSIMTSSNIMKWIACIWCYSILTSIVPQLGWRPYPSSLYQGHCLFNVPKIYGFMLSMVNFVITPFIMTVLYLRIYKIAKGHAHRINELERRISMSSVGTHPVSEGKTKTQFIARNVKASKTLLLIIIIFYVCWAPATALTLVTSICEECYKPDVTPPELFSLLLWLGYMNSAVNPPLYALHDRKLRNAYKNLIFQILRAKS